MYNLKTSNFHTYSFSIQRSFMEQGNSVPISAFIFLCFSTCAHVYIQIFHLLQGHQPYWIRVYHPNVLILTWSYEKILFSNNVTFIGTGV